MTRTQEKHIDEKSFKDRLRERIGDLKPHAWGKSLGLSTGLINRIFNEGAIPGSQNLIKISKGLGVSIDWLLMGGHATKISHTLFSLEEIENMEKIVTLIRNPVTKGPIESMVDLLLKIPEEEVKVQRRQSKTVKLAQ